MDKLAYEFGIECAMIDAGLMEKQAMNPVLRNALLGSAAGAGVGALASPEESRIQNALIGAGLGGLGGAVVGRTVGKAARRRKYVQNTSQRILAKMKSGARDESVFRLGDPSWGELTNIVR